MLGSGVTPVGQKAMVANTPTPSGVRMTPEQLQAWRWEKEIDQRNRAWTDEELDALFPEGYKVRTRLFIHVNYVWVR